MVAYGNRLVAADKNIRDHLVVFLLRVLVRGSHEYDKLVKDAADYAEGFVQRALKNADLSQWLDQRLKTPVPTPPPPPSSSEVQFLWGHGIPTQTDDVFVFETPDWIESIAEQRVASRLVLIPETISKILDADPDAYLSVVDRCPDLKIVFRFFPEKRWLVLLSALLDPPEERIKHTVNQWDNLVRQDGPQAVMRASARSYPSLICYDPDLWVAVEKEPFANLALSPEEATILDSTRHGASGYPLFINGRAGSGKSTILQYLFASQYAAWFSNLRVHGGEGSRPLYFASSSELLKVAQRVVRSLLTANSNMLLRDSGANTDDALQQLPNSFCHFHDFFYSLLDRKVATTSFRRDWRVTYSVFRTLWLQHFGKEPRAIRDFGPQLSWHVIRSYVKGISLEGETDHDDYLALPRDERTVSHDRFQDVYEKVWASWYRPLCKEQGFWDDQDLVRFLLDNAALTAQHSAIACDEAQDFTRIELEAIYRLCLFANRFLEPESIRRVPLAFAGDPFQTLNPTGFRWEAIKAGFTERLLCSLHRFKERSAVPHLNYHELSFNYRSTKNIVRFCNTIQAVRAAALAIPSLRPQTAWRLERTSAMPAFFAESDPALLNRLRQKSDVVIIVPCEEGEEQTFVRNSAFLASWVKFDEQGTPENVLSPNRAKGLEFNRVLLYGFGQRPEVNLLQRELTARPGSKDPDRDATLPLEYFLNALYVAASRARKRLFVVDTEQALSGLWRFAVDEDYLLSLMHLLPNNGDAWRDSITVMLRGLDDHWSDEDRDNPRDIAERYEEKGKRDRDPYFLRQAAIQYSNLKEPRKAEECRAFADRYEEKYEDSGQRFQRAAMYADALRAFWEGALFAHVRALSEARPEIAATLESRIAVFLTEPNPSVEAVLRVFEHVSASIRDTDQFHLEFLSLSWQKAIREALRKATSIRPEQAAPATWHTLAATVSDLQRNGATFDSMLVAKVLYSAGQFDDVLTVLADQTANELYRDAKAELILRRYQSDPAHIPPDEAKHLGDFLHREKRTIEAARWFRTAGDLARTEECLAAFLADETTSSHDIVVLLAQCLVTAADKGSFDYILALCLDGGASLPTIKRTTRGEGPSAHPYKDNRLAHLTGAQRKRLLDAIQDHNVLFTRTVPILARSPLLNWGTARDVADFLRRHLLVDEISWRKWRAVLPAIIAGAAIERAGKDIDALVFYERLKADREATPDQVTFAKKRWIRCKLRQAQRERALADSEKRATLQATATEHQAEADHELLSNGWSSADLGPELPELRGLTDIDGLPSSMTTVSVPTIEAAVGRVFPGSIASPFEIGGLTFRPFPDRHRINVESATGDTARIDLTKREVTSDDIPVSRSQDGSFLCQPWQLSIHFHHTSSGVVVQMGGVERTVQLE